MPVILRCDMPISNLCASERTLSEWLDVAQSEHPKRIDMSLERLRLVAQDLGLLHPEVPVVTIAGTNGKGSTVATLTALYLHCGLTVGTFTSPHLLCFNERICINGQPLSDAALCRSFEIIAKAKGIISLTYFEWSFLIALLNFKTLKVDRIVLEVGMGGRLDSTNLIDASLAVITPIDYDHQEFLGDTLDAIAYEKAGILRAGAKAVIAKEAMHPSLLNRASGLGVQCVFEGKDFDLEWDPVSEEAFWCLGQSKTAMPSHGLAPASVSLGCAAFAMLEERLPPLEALANERLPGRYYEHGAYIFDVAHNPAGARWLAARLAKRVEPMVAVWASFKDKEIALMASEIAPHVTEWVLVALEEERAATLETLRAVLPSNAAVTLCTNVEQAFEVSSQRARDGAKILVWGGFSLVGAMMSLVFSKKDKE